MNTAPASAERLAASRERLRQALRDDRPATTGDPASPLHAPWLDSLRQLPGVAVVSAAVRQWWIHHPLHAAALVALGSAQALVRPLARRHPLGLVAVGLVAGAAIVVCRPWRWALKPALFAGLLPQLLLASLACVRREVDPPPTHSN